MSVQPSNGIVQVESVTVTPISANQATFVTKTRNDYANFGFADQVYTRLRISGTATSPGPASDCYFETSNYSSSSGRVWYVGYPSPTYEFPNFLGQNLTSPSAGVRSCNIALDSSNTSYSRSGQVLTTSFKPIFDVTYNSGTKAIYGSTFGAGQGFYTPEVNFGSITVVGAPTVSLTSVSTGTGASQTFTAQYSPTGSSGLNTADILINSSTGTANACYVRYDRVANRFYLRDDAGNAWLGGNTPGTGSPIENTQCSIATATATATVNGSTGAVTLGVPVTFKPAFFGAKFVYLQTVDVNSMDSGLQQKGSWTVDQPPSGVSVGPPSGSGLAQAFDFTFADANGATDLSDMYAMFNTTTANGISGCAVRYLRTSNGVYLRNDAGSAWLGPVTPGSANTLSNNNCSLNALAFSVTSNGNDLTVSAEIAFTVAFAGAKNVYLYALDAEGMEVLPGPVFGTWTVPTTVTVTVDSLPSGKTISADGGAGCTAPCAFQWAPGSVHNITASAQAAGAGAQHVLTSFQITTPSAPQTYTANFTLQHYLTTSIGLAGAGTVSPASGWYDAGTVVSLSGTANAGYKFTNFSGDFTATSSPQNLLIDAAKSVTANFVAAVAITVTSSPAGYPMTADAGTANPVNCTSPCSFQWFPSDVHVMTASPQPDGTGRQYALAPLSITTPSAAQGYTATFTLQFYLTTGASAGGTISPASGWYNTGMAVSVAATPNAGYGFLNFSGASTATTSPQNITMDAAKSITANFAPIISITLASSPAGRSLSADGTNCTAPCAFSWTQGSSHTIAVATSPQAGSAGTQYVYTNWSDAGAQSHSITVPASAATYTASFATQYLVTVVASPSAGGSATGNGWYTSGAGATVTATANANYRLTGFSGDLTASTSPQTVVVNAPLSITANFQAWYNTGGTWTHRKLITLNNVVGSQTDFPVLISRTDTDLAANARADGADILFTSSDAITKLSHELEQYSSGTLVSWVRVPALSAGTTIYMYYGNASSGSQQNAAGVWDSAAKGVWHLGTPTTLTTNDSTSPATNGTAASVGAAAGQIHGGGSFNGTSSTINLGNVTDIQVTGAITLSAWVNVTAFPASGNSRYIIDKGKNGASEGYFLKLDNSSGNRLVAGGSANVAIWPVTGWNTGEWHYVAATYNGTAWSLFFDGVQKVSTNGTGAVSTSQNARIGSSSGNGSQTASWFSGAIDEARLSSMGRSGNWITTEYNNQSSPATFHTFGSQE